MMILKTGTPQPTPRPAPQVLKVLNEFERLLELGCSFDIIKEQFVKDELLIVAMFYREKNRFLNDVQEIEPIEIQYV